MSHPNKQHARNALARPTDYPNSPHVSGAIAAGTFTECRLITDRVVKHYTEVTCVECLKLLLNGPKVRVDYEEVMEIRARRKKINDLDLNEIAWYKEGRPMDIPAEKLEEFKFIGLSNMDFLTYEITSLTSVGGVQVNSIKI